MKPQVPKHLTPQALKTDSKYAMLLARYPVHLLHDLILGVLLGSFLVIGLQSPPSDPPTLILKIDEQDTLVHEPDQEPTLGPVGSPGTADDSDGDGIPNDWEISHSHNPNNTDDAASDFDSDGLTTLQEYELWNRTNGLAGNPLGKWTTLEMPIDPIVHDTQEYDYFYQGSYVAAANDTGDIVISYYSYGTKTDGSWTQTGNSALIHSDGTQQAISIPGKSSGFTYASDINDRGDVLLQWYSDDWSTSESYILKSDASVTQLTLNGNACFAYRMNNFGDWIGYEITTTGEWKSVQVVDGVNVLPNEIFTSWYYFLDINDYGQAIGSYYDVMENNNLTFTQLGSMFFSTGRAGDNPTFNESTYQWQWPAALNQWGEFAGGGCGYMPNGDYRNSAFFFDGSYHDVSPREDQNYAWASDLSDAGMVLLTSYSYTMGKYTSHLWRDSVSVNCDALIPEDTLPSDGSFVYPTKLTPNGKIFITRYDTNWQTIAIITLTPNQDVDGDGMPDDWEEFYGFNPFANDGFLDYDSDGTNNLGEFLLRSDPQNPPVFDSNGNPIDTRPGVDTDGDGIPNNWEVTNGLNYEDRADAPLDFDRDGYSNLQEFHLNTDPRGAPSYRIRKLGPFPGTSSVDLTNTTLGNGVVSGNPTYFSGDQITEQVFFRAWTSDGICKPAVWSQARTENAGQFSFYDSNAPNSYEIVAQSPSGAMLTRHGYYPAIYSYWSSPSAEPITLLSQMDNYDINSLYNVTFSPSGNYLFAVRSLDSETSVYEPIVWKMPSSDKITHSPLILTAPAGASFNAWTTAYINDYGIITANGTVDEQNRPLVWSFNEGNTAIQSSIMPTLPGGSGASVVGLSNHSTPIIAGTANNAEGQERATVWKYNNPTAITASDLGTLKNGNYSQLSKISPNGTLAGMANTLANDTLEYRIFSAAPVIPAEASSIDPSLYTLTPQEESSSWANITELVDSGEILATTYDPTTYQAIRSLGRHGRSHSLEDILPPSSGYTLATIKSINALGTLLVTAWKDNMLETLLLTPDQDTDGDGLPDAFENANQFNAFVKNNPATDTDNDSLTDLLEFANGTNPRLADTDSDGMQDSWEISWALNPLDAADANLDPDGDRVTNLRESQIGTNPTGIYRTDVIYTDEEYTNSYPSRIFDNGKFILSTYDFSNFQADSGSSFIQRFSLHNKLISYPSVTEHNFKVVITQAELPSNLWEYHYDYSWNWLGSKEQRYAFYFDPTTNHINSDSYNYDNQNYGDGSYTWLFSQTGSLQPDILTPDPNDSSSPFATPIIVSNLNSYGTADGNYYDEFDSEIDYLEENEILYPSYLCASPNGRHRIYATSNGRQIHLNEKGEFIEVLPYNDNWTHINNNGVLIRYENEYVEETSDTPAHYLPKIIAYRQEYGYMTYDLNATSEDSAILNYPSIIQFSDDHKILLSQYDYANGTSRQLYYLADLTTHTLKKVKSTGLGNEYITHLSTTNGRMVGNGSKPWQITPDGTCIRLEGLRIQNSLSEPQQTLKCLYHQAINPVHISPTGSITATTTDSQNHPQIIRIIPANDLDNDGIADDWELVYAEYLRDFYDVQIAAIASQIDANTDYTNGDGITAHSLFSQNAQAIGNANSAQTNQSNIPYNLLATVHVVRNTASFDGGYYPLVNDYPWGHRYDDNLYMSYSYNEISTNQSTRGEGDNKMMIQSSSSRHYSERITSSLDHFNSTHAGYHLLRSAIVSANLEESRNSSTQSTKKSTSSDVACNINFTLSPEYGVVREMINGLIDIPTYVANPHEYARTTTTKISENNVNKTEATTTMIQILGYPSVMNPFHFDDEYDEDVFTTFTSDKLVTTYNSDTGTEERTKELTDPTPISDLSHELLNNIKFKSDRQATRNDRLGGLLSNELRGEASPLAPEAFYEKEIWNVIGDPIVDISFLEIRTFSNYSPANTTNGGSRYLKARTEVISHTIEAGQKKKFVFEADPKSYDLVAIRFSTSSIELGGQLYSSATKPFRFWANYDQDDAEEDEPSEPVKLDCSHGMIDTMRDLEDFTTLKIETGLGIDSLQSGDFTVGLSLIEISGTSPSIRIYENLSVNENNEYLTDTIVAAAQINKPSLGLLSSSQNIPISNSFWSGKNNGNLNLIFEGCGTGVCKIFIKLFDRSGKQIGGGSFSYLQLLNVREMYQRAKIKNNPFDIQPTFLDANPQPQTWEWDPNGYNYVDDPEVKPKTVIFVHGWNMDYLSSNKYAETTYKRIWHQGFRGKFYSFRWPTFTGLHTYNASEYRAWLCGPTLAAWVNHLPNPTNRNLIAHSMGNVIAGAALRCNMKIERYAMCNAAMSATSYDTNVHAPTVFPSPDTDSDPSIRATYGLYNKFNKPNITSNVKIINFGLPDDFALATWSINNSLKKPDSVLGYSYQDSEGDLSPRGLTFSLGYSYRSIVSLSEAMGFVTQSRSRTAGAELATRGSISEHVDMSSFGFASTHSAQFVFNIQKSHEFWLKIFNKLALK